MSFARLILCGIALGAGLQAAAQEVPPVAADIAGLRAVLADFGSDTLTPEPAVSQDMLFVLDQIAGLSRETGAIAACRGPVDMPERGVTDPDCLAATLAAHRANWRAAAELAEQLHHQARAALAGELAGSGDEAMTLWWREALPGVLEAYAQIGREWIRLKESDEDAALHLSDALNRVGREPAALRLAGVQDDLVRLLATAMDSRQAHVPRLDAAAAFAGALDERLSELGAELVESGSIDAACGTMLTQPGLQDADCSEALAILRSAVVDNLRLAGDGAVDAARSHFQQALLLGFEERVVSLRQLVARLAAVEGTGDCTRAMTALSTPGEESSLNPESLQRAAQGFATLTAACLPDDHDGWVALACQMGAGALAPAIRDDWDAVLAATGGDICRNPEALSEAAQAALNDFLDAAAAMPVETAVRMLGQMPLPAVPGQAEAAAAIAGLCAAAARVESTDAPDFAGQIWRQVLADLGVLEDGTRSEAFAAICTPLGAATVEEAANTAQAITTLVETIRQGLNGDTNIAVRLAAAMAVAEGIEAAKGVEIPFSDCPKDTQPGLGALLTVTAPAATLDGDWQVTLSALATLRLCGPNVEATAEGNAEEELPEFAVTRRLSLEATATVEATRPLAEGLSADNVVVALKDAAARVDTSALTADLATLLPDILRTAGIDMAWVTLLDNAGISVGWDGGDIQLTGTIHFGVLDETDETTLGTFDFCLRVPVFEGQDDRDCPTIQNFGTIVDRIGDHLAEAVAGAVETSLNRIVPDLPALGTPRVTVQSRVGSGTDPAAVIRVVWTADPAAPFSGAFGAEIVATAGGITAKPMLPEINPAYVLQQAGLGTDASYLAFTPVTGATAGVCPDRHVFRVTLGSEMPLTGALGHVCLTLASDDIRFVPPTEGAISTADGMWRFTFNRFSGIDEENDAWRLALSLETSDRRFPTIDGIGISVLLNPGNGDWSIPAQDNRDLYRAIEAGINDQLPAGLRIRDIAFSSAGIELAFDEERAVTAILDASGDLGLPVDAAVDAGCATLRLHRLVAMIADGKVAVIDLPECGTDSLLEGAVNLFDTEDVRWVCQADSNDPGAALQRCDIQFARDLTFCGRAITVGFTWQDGVPQIDSRNLVGCFEGRIDDLLPNAIAGAVTVDTLLLAGDCIETPADCRLELRMGVSLAHLVDGQDTPDWPEECGIANGSITLVGQFGFTGGGRVALDHGDIARELGNCFDAITTMIAGEVLGEYDGALDTVAQSMEHALDVTRQGMTDLTGRAASCDLILASAEVRSCEGLAGADLRGGDLRGFSLVAETSILDERVRVRVDIDLDTDFLQPGSLMALLRDTDAAARQIADSAGIRVTLLCGEGDGATCIGGMLHDALEGLDLGIIAYDADTPLRVASVTNGVDIAIPLHMTLPGLSRRISVEVSCAIRVASLDPNDIALDCANLDLRALAFQAIGGALAELEGETLDLGLVTLTLGSASVDNAINVPASVAIAGLDGLDVPAKLSIDRNLSPSIALDTSVLERQISDALTGSINDLVGGFLPVTITDIKVVDRDEHDIPTAVAISSEANIAGYFRISAPRLLINSDGIRFDGPRRFSISFPPNAQILIPPFAICPTGGAVEDTQLTINASVTIGECTATYLMDLRGAITVDLEHPDTITQRGDLVLITVLPLGHVEGKLDLGAPRMSQTAAIGGALSDIVSLNTEYVIEGDPANARAHGNLSVFRVPVGTADFLLTLETGILGATLDADLGFARGSGAITTQSGFSRPEARLSLDMEIGDFPVVSATVLARPRAARVELSVLGLRLAVVLPGLDGLRPDLIADLLKNLLEPDFENIDKAIAALLRGDITLNPFGGFGSGDRLGDDGDGDDGGEGGEGARAPGDDLGMGEGLAQTAGPPGGEAGGHAGLLGSRAADVTFTPEGEGERVRVAVTETGAAITVAQRSGEWGVDFGEGGQPVGTTLTVFPFAYSQLLSATPVGEASCAGYHIVALYTGQDEPRRAAYELCRMRDANNNALTSEALAGFNELEKADLSAFHAALAADLAATAALPAEGRILLGGRMFAEGELHGVIGFQRPGELLVVARGPDTEASCGTPPAPTGAPAVPRIFWLTGVEDGVLDDPAPVIPAIRSLWNCRNGTLARLKDDRLVTPSDVMINQEGGYTPAGSSGPDQADLPDWVAALIRSLAEEQEAAAEEAETERIQDFLNPSAEPVANASVALLRCEGLGCGADSLTFAPLGDDGRCALLRGGQQIESFYPPVGFEGCVPQTLIWLDTSTRTAILSWEESAITLAAFRGNHVAVMGPLTLSITRTTATLADIRFLAALATQAAQIPPAVQVIGAGDAAIVETPFVNEYIMVVRDPLQITRIYGFLPERQATALLPYLGEDVRSVTVVDEQHTVILDRSPSHELLSWDGSAWTVAVRMQADTRHPELSQMVLLGSLQHLEGQSPPILVGTFVEADGGPAFGYAWTTQDGLAGGILSGTSEDVVDPAQVSSPLTLNPFVYEGDATGNISMVPDVPPDGRELIFTARGDTPPQPTFTPLDITISGLPAVLSDWSFLTKLAERLATEERLPATLSVGHDGSVSFAAIEGTGSLVLATMDGNSLTNIAVIGPSVIGGGAELPPDGVLPAVVAYLRGLPRPENGSVPFWSGKPFTVGNLPAWSMTQGRDTVVFFRREDGSIGRLVIAVENPSDALLAQVVGYVVDTGHDVEVIRGDPRVLRAHDPSCMADAPACAPLLVRLDLEAKISMTAPVGWPTSAFNVVVDAFVGLPAEAAVEPTGRFEGIAPTEERVGLFRLPSHDAAMLVSHDGQSSCISIGNRRTDDPVLRSLLAGLQASVLGNVFDGQVCVAAEPPAVDFHPEVTRVFHREVTHL